METLQLKHGVGGRTMQTFTAGAMGGVIGLRALDDMLIRMPAKIQQAIMRRAMQQALKPFFKQAKKDAPVAWQRYEVWGGETGGSQMMAEIFNRRTRARRGHLKKSIKRRTKSNRLAQEFSGNLFVQHKKFRVYYSHLTEWGTKAHFINNFFGHQGNQKWVKGQKAQKWMTRAWKKKWKTSLRNFSRVIKAETKRQFRIYVMQLTMEERQGMVSEI